MKMFTVSIIRRDQSYTKIKIVKQDISMFGWLINMLVKTRNLDFKH